ncbi:amidohydrolase family protein [Streptomyces sp. JH14]|uniref:amidohydrolase family protein n=1 Tax=Streptomyces sp. JH14 TaxID=2793630 RepID=UPI0023F6C574|nr:amidohydrolase family protein [Streptomyces sp. JH14]MDF6040874.1 amidohydrolase family protein [Streptomyces sp. JH14]
MAHEDVGAPVPFAAPAEGTVVLYRGATLIDGTGGPARPSTSVVVDGAHIRAVAPDGEIPAALLADAQIVDLQGDFVVPGLIDSHQHIATPPNRPVAEAALRRQVYGGVTAIRDMADDLRQVADLARATLVGEIPGPDIHYAALTAGPGFFDDPRTWQVSQGAVPGEVPWMQAVTDATDLPLAIALARGTHATAVKIYADLPAATVAAITAEAHRQGLGVWAHAAVFPASPGEVVDAGVDAVSHVHLLVHEFADRPLTTYKDKPPVDRDRFVSGDDREMAGLFARMRERGTVLDATNALWDRLADDADTPEAQAQARANAELSAALTGQAFRAGVEISAGTDYETEPAQPYPSLHDELVFLVERCGIPAVQAIRSATLVGALSMGAEDVMGTVAEGKLANFVVLRQDPLADIRNLRSISCVVKRGLRLNRAGFTPQDDTQDSPEGRTGR